MSIIRLGSPAVPVKITETGTCLAKLEHVWQAGRNMQEETVITSLKLTSLSALHRFEVTQYERGSRF